MEFLRCRACVQTKLFSEGRRADRNDTFGKEQFRIATRKVTVSDPNGSVKRSTGDIGVSIKQPQAKIEWMDHLGQFVQARYEPGLSDSWVRSEHEGRGGGLEFRHTGIETVQADGDVTVESTTGVGQFTAVGGSGEEVTAEAPFECSDLAGHGRLGHPQLACGSREASQPRSRVEDSEPVETTDRLDDWTYHASRLCQHADLVAVQGVQAAAE